MNVKAQVELKILEHKDRDSLIVTTINIFISVWIGNHSNQTNFAHDKQKKHIEVIKVPVRNTT